MTTGEGPSRRCGRCGRFKSPEAFAWRRKALGQKDNYCRPCRAAYKQEHYAKNRQRYKINASTRRQRVLHERWLYLIEYLRARPCADCGEDDVLVLEFDHLSDKHFNISGGLPGKAWDVILREIEKCEVVCANCHRRRSARRHGYLRAVLDDN